MERNITKTMPTRGNFLAVWEYNGTMWSRSFDWYAHELYVYDACEDEWVCATSELISQVDKLVTESDGFYVLAGE